MKSLPKILVIPDTQCKAGVDLDYLRCIGKYIVDKKPDIVVQIGDFADMESLSSYDKGKRSYENRRYKTDIEAAQTGMSILMKPLIDYNAEQKKLKKKLYSPWKILTLGNHENRIDRATQIEPMLYGTISVDDLNYQKWGWEVVPFLEIKIIGGVAFSHYFQVKNSSNAISSATALLNNKLMSCIAGHQQGRQSFSKVRADGKIMTAIIAGSSYTHHEDYLGVQGNKHWRGIVMLHNVEDGQFDEVYIPMSYLMEKYKSKPMYFNPKEVR